MNPNQHYNTLNKSSGAIGTNGSTINGRLMPLSSFLTIREPVTVLRMVMANSGYSRMEVDSLVPVAKPDFSATVAEI